MFDVSFLDDDTIQRTILLLEEHLSEGHATLSPKGAVLYSPDAGKHFARFYQLSEHIRYSGQSRQLRAGILKLLHQKGKTP